MIKKEVVAGQRSDTIDHPMANPMRAPKIAPDQGLDVIGQPPPQRAATFPISPPASAPQTA